jgi:hypothetical protein
MTDNVKLDGEVAVESVSPGQNEVSDLLVAEISSEVSYIICIHLMIKRSVEYSTSILNAYCLPLQYMCFFFFLCLFAIWCLAYIYFATSSVTTKQNRIQM